MATATESDASVIDRKVQVLKAIAHPVRFRIVTRLCAGTSHVNGLAEELDVPQTIISQQLRILRMSELVDVQRSSGFAVYRLAEPHLKSLIRCMDRCCDPK